MRSLQRFTCSFCCRYSRDQVTLEVRRKPRATTDIKRVDEKPHEPVDVDEPQTKRACLDVTSSAQSINVFEERNFRKPCAKHSVSQCVSDVTHKHCNACSSNECAHQSMASAGAATCSNPNTSAASQRQPLTCRFNRSLTSSQSSASLASSLNDARLMSFSDVTCSDLSETSERLLQQDLTVRTLRHAEKTYISEMQEGVELFARPLRICVTSQERAQLFQNIEKLVALSEFILTQVNAVVTSSDDSVCVTDVCDVYANNLSMLASSYGSYVRGIPVAMATLEKLHRNSEFVARLEVRIRSCFCLSVE